VPGDSFGELGLLEGRPRTATVRARTDAEVFMVDAGAFTRLLAPALSTPSLLPTLGPALEVQSLPPFRKLGLGDAGLVAERSEWLDVPAGIDVVAQGDACDGFYVIVSGQADVERDGKVVARLRTGDHFGEAALLRGGTRNATVRTTTRARIVRVDDSTFHALVASAFQRHVPAPVERALGGEFE
jgi:CRP-like cAMP-binding protein